MVAVEDQAGDTVTLTLGSRQEGAPDHLIMLCAVDLRIVFRLSAATQERHTCQIAESSHVTNL